MGTVASVILGAGHGTRMRSALPKVLHPVARRPMLHHVMDTAQSLGVSRQVVVIGSQAPEVGEVAQDFDADSRIAVQDPPQGTGDAVTCAMPHLDGIDGVVLILYADTPLVTQETLRSLIEIVVADADVAVLGFEPDEPGAYGRLILDDDQRLDRIVEAKDANSAELAVSLCNSGVMAVRTTALREFLPKVTNDNAKGEYYLTDVVGLVTAAGGIARVVTGAEDEVYGVNDRAELSVAERIFQQRRRLSMMSSGVTLLDPETTYFCADTNIAPDAVIGPNVVFGAGVTVEANATIEAFSHVEGAHIRAGATVGPFARIRPGSDVGEGAKIGNFVETKKAVLARGAKINHLSYIGDAEVGEGANVGAGTITCNYDGFGKFKTHIGKGAFVGSNSSLVAPVSIGDGAYVGSGSVITKDVTADSLAVARGRQLSKPDWAVSFRTRRQQETGK